MSAGVGSSKTPPGTAGSRATRSTKPAAPSTPGRRPPAWGIYQRIVAAYREPDKKKAKAMMQEVIAAISSGVPAALVEVRKLGRTMKQRAGDILAFFDRPGTSNGPTEAINGRLEHLRGSALGFRNLTHYIARSLLEAGGFRPALHPRS